MKFGDGTPFISSLLPSQGADASFAFKLPDEELALKDALKLVEEFDKTIDPRSEKNIFRECLYNRIDPKHSKDKRSHLLKLVPQFHNLKEADGKTNKTDPAPTDFYKWMKAVKYNPSPEELCVWQISSVTELTARSKQA